MGQTLSTDMVDMEVPALAKSGVFIHNPVVPLPFEKFSDNQEHMVDKEQDPEMYVDLAIKNKVGCFHGAVMGELTSQHTLFTSTWASVLKHLQGARSIFIHTTYRAPKILMLKPF